MHSSWGLGFGAVALGFVVLGGCSSEAESLFAGGQTTGGGGTGGMGQGGATASSAQSTSASSTSASSSSSTAASTSASSSSSGGFDPQACGTCAFQACQAEIFACGQTCQSFATCAQNCTDKPCIDACLAQYPQAVPAYNCTCASCAADCGTYCSAATGSSSASSGGGPACAKCGDILQGSQDPPCQGSDTLAGSLFVCTCQQSCTAECGSSCQGGQPSQTCLGCVQQKCGMQLNACLQD